MSHPVTATLSVDRVATTCRVVIHHAPWSSANRPPTLRQARPLIATRSSGATTARRAQGQAASAMSAGAAVMASRARRRPRISRARPWARRRSRAPEAADEVRPLAALEIVLGVVDVHLLEDLFEEVARPSSWWMKRGSLSIFAGTGWRASAVMTSACERSAAAAVTTNLTNAAAARDGRLAVGGPAAMCRRLWRGRRDRERIDRGRQAQRRPARTRRARARARARRCRLRRFTPKRLDRAARRRSPMP